MNRWRRPLLNALFFVSGVLALGMVQGLMDPANEKDSRVRQEKHQQAVERIESMPPPARLGHPLDSCTWHANWGPGEKPQPRCYIPKADR